ncbi:hypothetical protein HAX54_021087, partial [Datura stramonium]|nr:hypothetical protein [Datura stramonium]
KKRYKVEVEKLKEEVSCTFSNSTVSPVALLELIDRIDKFGLSSYFEVETKEALEKIIMCMNSSGANYFSSSKEEDLYATALCFRLLREHDYHASQRNLDIIEDLFFARDRIVESFFFAVGIASEPQYGSIRKWVTKVFQLVLIIDDVYDIYGALADVQQFAHTEVGPQKLFTTYLY